MIVSIYKWSLLLITIPLITIGFIVSVPLFCFKAGYWLALDQVYGTWNVRDFNKLRVSKGE